MPATADAPAKKAKKADKASKKGSSEGAPDAAGPSVAAHPRAARHVARAKGWGGLIGFALGGYLSLPTSTLAAAGLRALIAGVACYLTAWAGAVFVWRQLVMLQIAGARERLRAPLGAHLACPRWRDPGRGDRRSAATFAWVARCRVIAYVGANRTRVHTSRSTLAPGAAGGRADMLSRGETFEFQLTLAPAALRSQAPAQSYGRSPVWLRDGIQVDQRPRPQRLFQFIFDYQRNEQRGAGQR